MRSDHFARHAALSRRRLLSMTAGLVATATAGAAPELLAHPAAAREAAAGGQATTRPPGPAGFDDSFSIDDALNGRWAAESRARYGADDQRGTLNEITPQKVARVLRELATGAPVATYNLAHLLVNGFPALALEPARRYEQRLVAFGYVPADQTGFFTAAWGDPAAEDAWRAADEQRGPLGYLQGTEPFGPNRMATNEERFLHGGTHQIGTQLDNLNHFGVGNVFYNGFDAAAFASPSGTTKLGAEHVGPFLTRGVLLDVLGLKLRDGSADVITVNGHRMLRDAYRITLEDLRGAIRRGGIGEIQAGDVVLIRTGWHHLAEDPATHERYLATEPGIFLREAKFLAHHRPAVVGADNWALELAGNPDVTDPWVFPVHQWLLTKHGIRIGEGIITDELAADGVFEFGYFYGPQHAKGATAGASAPGALAPRTRR